MWLFSYICACTLKCIQVTRLVDLIPLYNSKKSLRYCTRYTYYRKACLLITTLTSSYVLNYFRSWNSGIGYMSYVIFLIIGPILFSRNSFLWNAIVTLFLFYKSRISAIALHLTQSFRNYFLRTEAQTGHIYKMA